MARTGQVLLIFSIFLGFFCENYSVNPLSLQLNKKKDSENAGFSKGNHIENPIRKIINGRRRLLFDEDMNPPINAERQVESDFSARRRSNFSEIENEKMSDWENVRLQFPLPVNPDNSRNFADFPTRQPPFTGMKNSNHKYEWGNRDDVFEKSQSRWNEEKSFHEILNKDFKGRNHYNGRYGDREINTEDRRGDIYDRRVSITTLKDAQVENGKNYHGDRVRDINSGYLGHSHLNHYNRIPTGFWNENSFKPEKGLVINLKTECSTPKQLNNQLVHKFIYAPKHPMSSPPEFSAFQIPESGYYSPHKITPVYYV